MLVFHGIKYEFNTALRFHVRYYLVDSLKLALKKYRAADGNIQQAMADIDRLLANPEPGNGEKEHSRKFNAVCLRGKDILRLFSQYSRFKNIVPVFEVLATDRPIEEKWRAIKHCINASYALEPDLTPEQFLFDESYGNDTLIDVAQLFFLDAVDEKPPANIILKLTPGKFPNHSWTSTDTVSERVLTEWVPRHPLTHKNTLIGDIVGFLYQSGMPVVQIPQNPTSPIRCEASKFDRLEPSEIFISLEDAEEGGAVGLPFRDTMDETFLRFQNTVAKKYKQIGLRFLAAILYEIHEFPHDQKCLVNPDKCIEKICGKSALAGKKNKHVLKEIFGAFLNIQVTRVYNIDHKSVARRNFFLTVLSTIGPLKKDRQEIDDDGDMEFLKDPLLVRDKDNHKPPGYGFRFLPEIFFTSDKIPPYYYEIGAFLTNTWFDNYPKQAGRAKMTPVDIMDRAGIFMSKTGQYKAIETIKLTLNHLKNEHFISYLNFNADSTVNLKEQVYEINAGDVSLAMIAEDYRQSKPPRLLRRPI